MADYLKLVLHEAPEALFPPNKAAEIIEFGNKIPPGFGQSIFGFECRLAGKEAPVDFATGLYHTNQGPSMVEEIIKHHLFISYAQGDSSWRRINDLIQLYIKERSLFNTWLENIIFEFDEETFAQTYPLPCVFLGIRPASLLQPERRATKNDVYPVIIKGLERVAGQTIPLCHREALQDTLDLLPEQAILFQAGAMLSREHSRIRICIRHMTMEETLSFLTSASWPGDMQALQFIAEIIKDLFHHTALSIDISDQLLPKIGIESYFYKKRQPIQEPKWKEAVSFLVREGFCAEDKGGQLLAYPAREEYFPMYSAAQKDRYPLIMLRGLHHLKFVVDGSPSINTKAYLYGRVFPMK